jgi:hypothetical protein
MTSRPIPDTSTSCGLDKLIPRGEILAIRTGWTELTPADALGPACGGGLMMTR